MSRAIELLRAEPRARTFFLVLAQSALGTGAAYVALLVVAYDRFHSAWAIGLVLFADLGPSMLLGPVFGAAADRWSRRACLILSDVLRAAAFVSIALVDSFLATFLLALLAGVGTGVFRPAALASLPSLVDESRVPAATALFGAVADLGFTAGPAIAAAAFLVAGPEAILAANAGTFAISALGLSAIRFGAAPVRAASDTPKSLLREAREGLGSIVRMQGIRAVIAASGAMLLFAGLFNVAELPLVRDDLSGGNAGFALLASIYGIGFVMGSLSGSRGGAPDVLKRGFLMGLAVVSLGFIACGASPGVGVATLAFALAGVGNGFILVYERLIVQTTVPDRLMARVFGAKDTLMAWAFALAFLGGGGLVAAIGARAVVLIAGAGGVVVWLGSRLVLRGPLTPVVVEEFAPEALARRSRAFHGGVAREDRADAVGGADDGGALLDHRH